MNIKSAQFIIKFINLLFIKEYLIALKDKDVIKEIYEILSSSNYDLFVDDYAKTISNAHNTFLEVIKCL